MNFSMRSILPCLLALVCLCLITSCKAMSGGGDGLPFVGFATVIGNGDVRTDGNVFLAMGDLQGDAGLFMPGSGFPITFPLDVKTDSWKAYRRTTKEHLHGTLGMDPLPEWTAHLFRPDELAALSARLGRPISIGGPAVGTEPPAPAPAPVAAPPSQ